MDPTQARSQPWEPLSFPESGQAEQTRPDQTGECSVVRKGVNFPEGQDSKEELKEGLQYKEEFAHREKIHRDVITEPRSEAQRRPSEPGRSWGSSGWGSRERRLCARSDR